MFVHVQIPVSILQKLQDHKFLAQTQEYQENKLTKRCCHFNIGIIFRKTYRYVFFWTNLSK